MKIYDMTYLNCAVLVGAMLVGSARGDETNDTPAELTPEQIAQQQQFEELAAAVGDKAFEQFVTLMAIQEAVHALDANALVDCALQLAHGERVLLRQHRSGITPVDFLRYAVNVAAEERDQASLERIAAAAKQIEAEEVLSILDAAKKLAESPRSAPAGLEDHEWIGTAIAEAELLRHVTDLDALRDQLPEALGDEDRAAAEREIEAAQSRIANAKANPILENLIEPSRLILLPMFTFSRSNANTPALPRQLINFAINVGPVWGGGRVDLKLFSGRSFERPDTRWIIQRRWTNVQGRGVGYNRRTPSRITRRMSVRVTATIHKSPFASSKTLVVGMMR